MFLKNVYTIKNLPVQQKERKWTDCCCTIITAIFALTLFILSFFMFHKSNYYKTNFPTDSQGLTCVIDHPDSPLIFFKDPKNVLGSRQCVSTCPLQGQSLICNKNSQSQCDKMGAAQYSSYVSVNRLGGFCMPVDEKLANYIWQDPQISGYRSLINSYGILLFALLFAILLGIIYLALTMLFPKIMVYVVFVLAFLLLLVFGILILAVPINLFSATGLNIASGVILIIFGFLLLGFLFLYRKQIQLSAIFIYHSNQFLKQSPSVIGYIPLFIILTIGLLILIFWQFIAFGTSSQPYLKPNHLYFSSQSNIVLQILNIIELIWGLQFLRDAFNFVVSGNSVEWYFKDESNTKQTHCFKPFTRLLCRNWGSVVGGSFLNAFLNIPTLISDLFRCDRRGALGKCNPCYTKFCICDYLFELVRTDSYSFINLTGVPYCDASRQCQALCKYSHRFNGSQSCIKLYRISSHICLVGLVLLICYLILLGRPYSTNVIIVGLCIFFAYCMITYFVDIHADGAEGLMVCYLTEQNMGFQQHFVCPPALRQDIYRYDTDNQIEHNDNVNY